MWLFLGIAGMFRWFLSALQPYATLFRCAKRCYDLESVYVSLHVCYVSQCKF